MSGDVHEPQTWTKDEYEATWKAALEAELAGAKNSGDIEAVKVIEAQLGRKPATK